MLGIFLIGAAVAGVSIYFVTENYYRKKNASNDTQYSTNLDLSNKGFNDIMINKAYNNPNAPESKAVELTPTFLVFRLFNG